MQLTCNCQVCYCATSIAYHASMQAPKTTSHSKPGALRKGVITTTTTSHTTTFTFFVQLLLAVAVPNASWQVPDLTSCSKIMVF